MNEYMLDLSYQVANVTIIVRIVLISSFPCVQVQFWPMLAVMERI